jgi:hypothetical protein
MQSPHPLHSAAVSILLATLAAACADNPSTSAPSTPSTTTVHHDAGLASGSSSGTGSSSSSGSGSSSGTGSSSGVDTSSSSSGSSSGPGGALDGGAPPQVDSASCPAAARPPHSSWAPLAAPVLSALDLSHSDPIPGDGGDAPPAGWNFYNIEGAICRDGSPLGIYVHQGTVNKMVAFFEGGGLCFSSHFCDHNPANMHQFFSSDPQTEGQTIGGSLGNLSSPPILQKPSSSGIFDFTRDENPFKDWNQVYIPYCTGDAHFGTIDQGSVTDYSGGQGSPGTATNNPGYHFVGFNNTKLIAGHLAATFPKLDYAVLTGSSAGGLGAVFNAGMIEETFGGHLPASVLIDSAAAFPDTKYMSACLQKEARTTYGWDQSLPSDCSDCGQPDGSGLFNILLYLHDRYPTLGLGLIMSIHDQIFRLFFSAGQGTDPSQPPNCDSNDPNILAALGLAIVGGNTPRYPASLWEEGLGTLRTNYDCLGVFSSYYIGSADPSASTDAFNPIDTLHMHIFRDRFYTQLAGSMTPAQWATDLVAGKMEDVGP